jgi:ribosomal protein L6P/L9E
MSRVAKNPITIPDSATVSIDNNLVRVKGVKGELDFQYAFFSIS